MIRKISYFVMVSALILFSAITRLNAHYEFDPATEKMDHIADLTIFKGERGDGIRTSGKIHVIFVEYWDSWNYIGYPIVEQLIDGDNNIIYGSTSDGFMERNRI